MYVDIAKSRWSEHRSLDFSLYGDCKSISLQFKWCQTMFDFTRLGFKKPTSFQQKAKKAIALLLVAAAIPALTQPASAALTERSLAWLFPTLSKTRDLYLLKNFEMVLLIDKSLSMRRPCGLQERVIEASSVIPGDRNVISANFVPNDTQNNFVPAPSDENYAALNGDESTDWRHSILNDSRWRWCQKQTSNLAAQTKAIFPDGVNVTMFSTSSRNYDKLSADQVQNLFSKVEPDGATRAALPLENQLRRHFYEQQRTGGHAKPMLIAVVTDGRMDDRFTFRQTIINATKQMKSPDELLIVILQIGNDPRATAYLQGLDKKLAPKFARYDIVEVRPFPQLEQSGLTRTFAEVISRSQQSQSVNL